MNYILFMIIIAFVITIFTGVKSKNEENAIITLMLFIFVGLFILGIRSKHIDFDNVDTNLRLVINDTMTNDEIISEIKELIVYETDGEVTDISTTIKDDKVSKLKFKDVTIKITEPIITKHLYISVNKRFKIIIKDGEVESNNIEIVGLKKNKRGN